MKKTYKIKGMHCNSCCLLIENELKDRVNSVKASYKDGKAEIEFDPKKISEKEIKEKIEKLGYGCGNGNENNNKKSALDKFGFFIFIAALLVVAFVIYSVVLKNYSLEIPSIGENGSLLLLFMVGILTGFHCVAMCGGFVVSYTTKNALKGYKGFGQHAAYGLSKVASYTLIGGIFGLIGGIFAFSILLRGSVAILAGIFMIFYALSMLGLKFFRRFQFNPKFLTKIAAKGGETEGVYKRPIMIGLLSGLFIACGPLQAMYLYAAGTGGIINGAASLFAFGIGTLPIMLGFGSLATVISHKTTSKILKIAAVIVLILGLIMLNRGLIILGSPYSFSAIQSKIAGNPIAGGTGAVLTKGVQEVNMDVLSSGYSPNSFVLKKGVPVKWNVNVKQLTSCNQELVLNQYGIDKNLKQGLNVIEFTPDKTGTITFSCGMGMLHGSFIVTESGTASQEQVKVATPSSGSSCNMGANGGSCGCGG